MLRRRAVAQRASTFAAEGVAGFTLIHWFVYTSAILGIAIRSHALVVGGSAALDPAITGMRARIVGANVANAVAASVRSGVSAGATGTNAIRAPWPLAGIAVQVGDRTRAGSEIAIGLRALAGFATFRVRAAVGNNSPRSDCGLQLNSGNRVMVVPTRAVGTTDLGDAI